MDELVYSKVDANVMAVYEWATGSEPALTEQYIYGSSRLGYLDRDGLTARANPTHVIGLRKYELTDHLGNVITTVSDRPEAVIDELGNYISGYTADIQSSQDYYPFGMLMPGRNNPGNTVPDGGYRFGYQGQEKDDEITSVTGSHLSFEYRIYDSRIGRFLSTDPFTSKYPFYSPYQFSGNRVIDMIELEGLEPTESGSYGGQGAIAPELLNGAAVAGTENQRWTWNNDAWGMVNFNVTNGELTSIFENGIADALKQIEIVVNLEGSTYGITSKQSLAHFLSQAGHEVGGFSSGLDIEENLNYSVDGLVSTFGKYFYKGIAVTGKLDAASYGYVKDANGKITQSANKEGIANQAYASRMGNGDFASGEGYLYRGRGIFQLTGKSNYTAFNTFMNITGVDFVSNPALITTSTEYSIKSAMWFYKVNVVDKLSIESTTVNAVTNKVNGGTNGISDRKTIYNKAIEKLK